MADIWLPVALRRLLERTEIGVMATSDVFVSMFWLARYRAKVSAHRPRTTSFRVTSAREPLMALSRDKSTLVETIRRLAVICRLKGLWGAVNKGSGNGSLCNCFWISPRVVASAAL